MRYSWVKALPFLAGLLLALLNYVLDWLHAIHVVDPNAAVLVMAGLVIGDYVRAQVMTWQAKRAGPPAAIQKT